MALTATFKVLCARIRALKTWGVFNIIDDTLTEYYTSVQALLQTKDNRPFMDAILPHTRLFTNITLHITLHSNIDRA